MKAFPSTIENHALYGETGMDLRDYFAAKALQAILSNSSVDITAFTEVAGDSYFMADAMLKAREA